MRHLRLKPTEIATSCPVDGLFLKINQRFPILPAQTDSARENPPEIKTSEEELATIYLTPLFEPCEVKVSSTVLRGEGARKGPALPGAL
jgi:hypothetical protein